ncbi:retrovirus-related pol polyprotein from transposon TNT 1-94 [Tanacetum coccineum]
MGLWYSKDSGLELIAYSDADHAWCNHDCKSTSRGIQFLGDYLVSWSSKKQDCTSMSTVEAETLILAEESRLKMVEKQNDSIMKKEKINITPFNYSELNKLAEDFGKRFVPQQELSAEQKFWLQSSDKNSEEPSTSNTPVKFEVPIELPNVKKKNEDSVDTCKKCLELEVELVKKNDVYIELSKRFSNLEQHCISLAVSMHLNKVVCDVAGLPLSSLQAKDTIISKLKETIHSLRENANPAKVKKDIDEIKTINIELEHSRRKSDLKTQIQEKVFANASLKNELRKLKGKIVINNVVSKPHVTTIAPGMFKLNLEPLAPKVLKNKDAHLEYIKHSRDHADILQEIVRKKLAVVQIVLWYLDSGYSKHMTENRSQLTNFVNKFLGAVKFGNDQISKIRGYGDYQIGNVTISRVYYVEGLGYNLFSDGQFCYSDLEVAFRKHTCFVRNLEGVDLLTRSRGTNLYTLSIGDMMKSSPICLLSKASKTKSWLWHRCLCHLNFGTINQLAKQGLVRGLPKLKFEKDHLCSAWSLGKNIMKMSVSLIKHSWRVLHNRMGEAVPTACYTQNRSLIRLCHRKIPYELLHGRKPKFSYLHVFGALCYLTNDSEDLSKLKAKADVGIFIGYALAKKGKDSQNMSITQVKPTLDPSKDLAVTYLLGLHGILQDVSGVSMQLMVGSTLISTLKKDNGGLGL